MYVIVKYATSVIFRSYWPTDPKEGVELDDSAHITYMGQSLGLKSSYPSIEAASKDCDRINQLNPSGYYEICRLIQPSVELN